MSGRYLLDTNVAIEVLNQEVDLAARRGRGIEVLLCGGDRQPPGAQFNPASKQQLMEGLTVAIQAREVSFPEGSSTAELLAFEYQCTRTGVRYAATEGMHDDCVDALAMAVRRRTRPSTSVWGLADAWGRWRTCSGERPNTEPERVIADRPRMVKRQGRCRL